MQWYKLASHLHMSKQRCQQEHTSMEFTMWMQYLEMKENEHSKHDYYLAQIAAEVRRPNSKHPENIMVKDFLFEYVQPIPEDPELQLKKKKAMWFRAVGLKSDDTFKSW